MERAEEFVGTMNYEEFANDNKTNFAVVRCIEIMGEATKHIPELLRQSYPEVPWRDMAGMRDKITHFYFGINLERVWAVVKEDIPQIKPYIKKILENI